MEDTNSQITSVVPQTFDVPKTLFFNFAFTPLQEWNDIHSPYEFMEKQMKVFMENANNYLEYMRLVYLFWFNLPQQIFMKTEELSESEKTKKKSIKNSAT
ncbi:hypothetical protein [Legionella sp. PC997]|uniref:hypothetical protein n=1 Tax=Legionella sp. PC997 TaxID=2755562 RepID=UPI0015FA369F|nr:hypothetical protein [Legionella sp. PC997]QMT59827.1 hypothetical protein HBNCFIEN_01196 [Legionella sp. PC997]